ncbi:MAG TPA: LysR family transcriptional regulator [Candidatus Dormibacteraeota bacterium]|nr:LysR family transcriptional regulator [Candidatus Dormibacteraeota bacterium]
MRYFLAVAEEQHFGRAAARLHMAQPPLSQAIKRLEQELGVALFDRSSRPIIVTRAGRALLNEIRPVIEQTEYAIESARREGRTAGGRLEVGTVGSAAFLTVPRILRTFREAFPEVHLGVTELTTPRQADALRAGTIDVALLRPPVPDETLTSLVIQREPFLLALPSAHPLALREAQGGEPIDLREVREEPFVLFERMVSPVFYDRIVGLCRAAGFRPRIEQHANLFPTIVALVAAGLGVAIVPASIRCVQMDGVAFRTIAGDAMGAELAVAWRTGERSPAVLQLVEVARSLGGA